MRAVCCCPFRIETGGKHAVNASDNAYAHSPEKCEEELAERILQMKAENARIKAEPGEKKRARVRNFRTRADWECGMKSCRKELEKGAIIGSRHGAARLSHFSYHFFSHHCLTLRQAFSQ